jgi:radical SAM protein with 4Fe4S-binding SPASM domain
MPPLLLNFKFWVNNKVIQSPLLADMAYRLAYHVSWISSLLRDKFAKFFPVKPEELAAVQSAQVGSYIIVMTTNICNAKCSFCAYPRVVANGTLETGVMAMPVFQKAVTEWASTGGNYMDFTPIVGDPLVDPGLIEKIKFAHSVGISRIDFTTNGILLNHHDNYKKLVDLKVHGIHISIGATDEAQYQQIYGVDQYKKVISGLRNLLEYNRQNGEPVYINLRFRNAQHPSEILNSEDFVKHIKPFLSKKVEVNFTVDFDNWGGTIRQEELPGVMRLRKPRPEIKIPCTSLFGFAVRHDGSVRLCGCRMKSSDLDDLVVGNINEQSLEEISSSAKTKNIIEGFYRGERPETCKRCTLYTPVTRSWLKTRLVSASRPKSKTTPLETAGK